MILRGLMASRSSFWAYLLWLLLFNSVTLACLFAAALIRYREIFFHGGVGGVMAPFRSGLYGQFLTVSGYLAFSCALIFPGCAPVLCCLLVIVASILLAAAGLGLLVVS